MQKLLEKVEKEPEAQRRSVRLWQESGVYNMYVRPAKQMPQMQNTEHIVDVGANGASTSTLGGSRRSLQG
eukprot:689667-Amphidinium_carterae.3